MMPVDLKVIVPGATEDELERGRVAAWRVFDNSGDHALAAFAARFKLEGEQEALTDADSRYCKLYDEAHRAAAAACCTGWANPVEHAELELDYDHEAYDAAYPPRPQIFVDVEGTSRRTADIHLRQIDGVITSLGRVRGESMEQIIKTVKERAALHDVPVELITIRDYGQPAYSAPGEVCWGYTVIEVD